MKNKKCFILHENIPSQFTYTAGSKARNDIESIIGKLGCDVFVIDDSEVPDRENLSFLNKLISHFVVYKSWKKQIDALLDNSTVIVQYPVYFHTFFFDKIILRMHKKRCRVIAIIHDLETLRLVSDTNINKHLLNKRLIYEEKRSVPFFDTIIVHNDFMKEEIINSFSIDGNKVKTIDIFDYLIPKYQNKKCDVIYKEPYSIAIAGNFDPEKSGYVYKLPTDSRFKLYGPNYQGSQSDSIHYYGAFHPDELPQFLNGDFGLVWDGPEINTCCGSKGDYLKFNNPHKTSLYLACGIPVIIWENAAVAKFIIDHKCGITIGSLNDLSNTLSSVTTNMYKEMKKNAETIGNKLRNGEFTRKAIINEL